MVKMTKLSYIDTDSFIAIIETEEMYVDIARYFKL